VRRAIGAVLYIAYAAAAAAGSPATISIRARDAHGAAVADARATLRLSSGEQAAIASTDASGACRFEGIAAGEYLVSVEASGFARSEPRRVRVDRESPVELDVELALAGLAEHVLVTASASAETPDELAKAVTAIDAREMETRGDVAIGDALRAVPGLRVQQLGGPGSATTVRIRGMRIEDTAVLIDGVRFRDPSGTQGDASAFVQDLIVTDLDRIEVLRGSGSSLYGSHAIGGVVNLLSAEGGGRPQGQLLLEGGTLGVVHGRGSLSGGLAQDRLAYSVGLARLDVSRGLDDHDAADNTSLQGRARLRVSPRASLMARIYGADAAASINETPRTVGTLPPGVQTAVPLAAGELRRYEQRTPISALRLDGANFITAADDPDNRRESRFRSGLLRFEQRPASAVGYSVSYHYLAPERVFLDGPLGVSAFEPRTSSRSAFVGRAHTLTARGDAVVASRHSLTAGYELEAETLENESLLPSGAASSTHVSQKSHAFFFQDQVRFHGDRGRVSGSYRVQRFDLGTPRFVPGANAPYAGVPLAQPPTAHTADGSLAYFIPATGTLLRSHVGTGYRAPSLFERLGSGYDSEFGYAVYGDPRLGPESSLGIDAGVEQTTWRGRLRLSATWFRTRLDDAILFDFSGVINPATDPFGRFGGYRSAGRGLSSGLELTAALRPRASASVKGAYTFVDADAPTGVADAPRALSVPRHQFSLVAMAGIDRDVTASVQLLAMSEVLYRIGSRVLRFDGPVRADAQIGYRPRLGARRPLRVFVRVENALDRTYFENGFRTPERTFTAGASLAF
jgi:iron complex outermembrane receptor protein